MPSCTTAGSGLAGSTAAPTGCSSPACTDPFGDAELDGAVSAAYRTLASAATYFFKRMVARGLVRADLDPEVAAWNLSGILHLHDPLWSAHSGRRAATLERRIVDEFVQDLKPRSASPPRSAKAR